MTLTVTVSWSINENPEIARIQFTKAQFMSLPAGIREMMIRLGWLANDILFFQRLFLATMNFDPLSDAAKDASNSHNITLTLTLLGKVFEGTRILEKWFFSAKESRDVLAALNLDQLKAVDELKKLMANTSRLRTVRNQFSSHYSIDDPISPMMQSLNEETILSLYLGSPDGNSLRAYAFQSMVSEIIDLMNPCGDEAPDLTKNEANNHKKVPLMNILATFIKNLDMLLAGIEMHALSKIFPDGFAPEKLAIPRHDYRRGVDIKFPPLVARPIPFATR